MKQHWRLAHKWSAGQSRGGSGVKRQTAVAERQAMGFIGVSCQRLFLSEALSRYVEVASKAIGSGEQTEDEGSELDSAVRELRALRELHRHQGEIVTAAGSARDVSPWPQSTPWPNHLKGLSLLKVAAVALIPRHGEGPVLATICESINRLVDDAYRSVNNDRVNIFDQTRMNSFLQRPRATG